MAMDSLKLPWLDYKEMPPHVIPGAGDMADPGDTNAATRFIASRGVKGGMDPMPIAIPEVGSGDMNADEKMIGD